MKTEIDIKNPCHEKWSNMQPNAEGTFCGVCNKTVFDFSAKTETQIREFFKSRDSAEYVCGKFKKTQLIQLNFDSFFSRFRLWAMTKRCAVIIFLAFGSVLFSCGSGNDEVMGEVPEPVGKVDYHHSVNQQALEDTVVVDTNRIRK